jgi:hypothetical protein
MTKWLSSAQKVEVSTDGASGHTGPWLGTQTTEEEGRLCAVHHF